MRIKFLSVALGLALTATVMSASAQKKYTEGVISISMSMRGQQVQGKNYFTPDSTAYTFNAGPANVKLLADSKGKSFVTLIDVPAFGVKKAAVSTPDEIDQAMSALPVFEFTPTTETKVISGFNCKKVISKDTKTGKTYDVWITNDVEIPSSSLATYYTKIGGFPVQYTSFSAQGALEVTVTGITDQKAPAGTFAIPSDFDRITNDELAAMRKMGGGR